MATVISGSSKLCLKSQVSKGAALSHTNADLQSSFRRNLLAGEKIAQIVCGLCFYCI